ncbi:hypothetical protein L3X38_041621 [Prunus dulcis]|uniref:Gnk2-homologous domain-containing protein n=1 Tax=Prunus dulcis TaxID=3755 RepID=A0AAD4UUD1_PRUDU|nr:hypothetical protein L3X38_041621 [Prunus dulcis]
MAGTPAEGQFPASSMAFPQGEVQLHLLAPLWIRHYARVGTAYGLLLCRGDVSVLVCEECVANATSEALLRCPHNQQAVVWYDHCTLRYSNQPFYSEAATSPSMISWSGRI